MAERGTPGGSDEEEKKALEAAKNLRKTITGQALEQSPAGKNFITSGEEDSKAREAFERKLTQSS